MSAMGVKAIRLSENLTQQEFAARLGVSQSLIGDVERGRRRVTENLRIRIAQQFGTGDKVIEAIARAKESVNLAI